MQNQSLQHCSRNLTPFQVRLLICKCCSIGMNLTFHHLVRNSRKRRYEQKIKEERDEKQEKLSKELIEKNQAIDRLLQKVDELEAFKAQNDENLEKLSSLYESGLIDENGNIINKNVKPDIMN